MIREEPGEEKVSAWELEQAERPGNTPVKTLISDIRGGDRIFEGHGSWKGQGVKNMSWR